MINLRKLSLSRFTINYLGGITRMSSNKVDNNEISNFKSERIKSLKDVEKYPTHFRSNRTVESFIKDFSLCSSEQLASVETVRLCGVMSSVREASKKLKFVDMVGNGIKLQLKLNAKKFHSFQEYQRITKLISRGDRIGVVGNPVRTKTGELSLEVERLEILSPCLHRLPTVGFESSYKRFRKRYVDFLVNKESREIIIRRANIIKYLRRFFEERDFIEVETPILSANAGGAMARPFVTSHNELEADLFLRVAPELYLKQMIIGGFDKVFEIGKQFRNEGVDWNHNPEFTSCEFYQAWTDFSDLILTTEQLLSGLVNHLNLEPEYEGVKLDFSSKLSQMEYMTSLEMSTGTTFPPPDQLATDDSIKFLISVCKQKKIDLPDPLTVPRLLDRLSGALVEPELIQPTLLTHHPVIMSPLAKEDSDRPGLAQRFELFVSGQELINAYSELNDPEIQRSSLQCQAGLFDPEAMVPDEDFCTALEYGLPPTAGWGCGIDRLVAVLCNKRHIRDTIAFPVIRN